MLNTTVLFNCIRVSEYRYVIVIDVYTMSLSNELCKREKKMKNREVRRGMCIVYSNSCSYLLFISKSHWLLISFSSQVV